MREFKVCEKFFSINGEGRRAGQISVFIRFKGCNLDCLYCDTKWANSPDAPYELMTTDDIFEYISDCGAKNVTLTGGEPLLSDGIAELLSVLKANNLRVEVETNGAVDLSPFCASYIRPSFTMDYKLQSSGMESKMLLSNFDLLQRGDCVKFVVGSTEDLYHASDVVKYNKLLDKCAVYFSPVFGEIEPAEIVEFMIEHKLNDINLQIQMHKVIWDSDKRGV